MTKEAQKIDDCMVERVASAIESVPTYLPLGHEFYGKFDARKERALQAIYAMSSGQWQPYPDNKPDDGEPVLIAALTTGQTSVVQFAKFHTCPHCEGEWELYESLEDSVITHFLRIPHLPPIHHVKNKTVN